MSGTDPEEIASQTNFIGWAIVSASPITCATDQRLHVSGSYGNCCSQDPCPIVTRCESDTMYDNQPSGERLCGTDHSCLTATIFPSYNRTIDGDTTSTTRLFCGAGENRYSIYTEFPVDEATITDSASLPTRTEDTASSSPTSDTDDPDDGSAGGDGKAWIAGAVVGPLALIAIAGLVFWLWKRKAEKKNHTASGVEQQHPGAYTKYESYHNGSSPPQWGSREQWSGQGPAYSSHRSPAELASNSESRRSELPSG